MPMEEADAGAEPLPEHASEARPTPVEPAPKLEDASPPDSVEPSPERASEAGPAPVEPAPKLEETSPPDSVEPSPEHASEAGPAPVEPAPKVEDTSPPDSVEPSPEHASEAGREAEELAARQALVRRARIDAAAAAKVDMTSSRNSVVAEDEDVGACVFCGLGCYGVDTMKSDRVQLEARRPAEFEDLGHALQDLDGGEKETGGSIPPVTSWHHSIAAPDDEPEAEGVVADSSRPRGLWNPVSSPADAVQSWKMEKDKFKEMQLLQARMALECAPFNDTTDAEHDTKLDLVLDKLSQPDEPDDPPPSESSAGPEASEPVAEAPKPAPAAVPPSPPPESPSDPVSPTAKESDFDMFKRALSKGVVMTKHCTNGRARRRVISCNDSFTAVGWKEEGKSDMKGELMMSRCSEVRKATEIDPASKVMGKPVTGTKALRASSLKDRNRAFSLIFPQRTLDIECQSEVECRFYMRGFRRWRAESVHSEAHT